jgi:hypothetical protein
MNASLQHLLETAERQLGAPSSAYHLPGLEGGLIGQFPMWHPWSSLYQLTSAASVAQRQAASCQTDPVVDRGAACIQVEARFERVQQDVACQTDPADTVQVGAGGGTSSGVVGEYSDSRGHHWKKKVANNMYTNPSDWNKYWADKRKKEEEKYLSAKSAEGQEAELPWKGKEVSAQHTGNKGKVL